MLGTQQTLLYIWYTGDCTPFTPPSGIIMVYGGTTRITSDSEVAELLVYIADHDHAISGNSKYDAYFNSSKTNNLQLQRIQSPFSFAMLFTSHRHIKSIRASGVVNPFKPSGV